MSRRPREQPRRGGKRAPKLPSIVLVFGEDENDRESIKMLLGALSPDLARRVQTRRHPLVLIKGARPEEVPDRAQRIADAVDAERVRAEVRCVFAHEDCDDVEPAHEHVAAQIESALRAVGCDAHAVAPAWEMEAWWFLWPDAVKAANPSWRSPNDYVGKNVGMIRDAKEELKRRVVPRGVKSGQHGFRGYRESDAPRIAAEVGKLGLANAPQASSRSYDRFRQSVWTCSAGALPAAVDAHSSDSNPHSDPQRARMRGSEKPSADESSINTPATTQHRPARTRR